MDALVSLKACRLCSVEFEPKAFQVRMGSYACRSCLNLLMRKHRALNEERGLPRISGKRTAASVKHERDRYGSDPQFRMKVRVRASTRKAIRSGRLVRQPCEVCGAHKVEAHHDDYSKPMEVRWLCFFHHREHHKATDLKVAA